MPVYHDVKPGARLPVVEREPAAECGMGRALGQWPVAWQDCSGRLGAAAPAREDNQELTRTKSRPRSTTRLAHLLEGAAPEVAVVVHRHPHERVDVVAHVLFKGADP